MDVMKPDLRYIDGICYRINPGNYYTKCGTPIGTQRYSEYECVINNESDNDDNFDVHVDENGVYKTAFHVAKTYFPYIIGSKGMTRKRLETETKARISVPKMGQSGDIIITGQDKKNVLSAKRRIKMIVISARKRQPFTHFISIPFIAQSFKDGFKKFKTDVLTTCIGRGIEESVFQSVDKLHLTIGVLVLCDAEERNDACSVLQKCKEEVIRPILDNKRLHLVMRGVEYMNDDPSEVDVLYGKVFCADNVELMQELSDGIMSYFVQAGLMEKKYERVKLHVTLMNTLFRNPRNVEDEKPKIRETFDATKVIEVSKYNG
ncbi:hypothetical protein AAG570_000980 [Ranatra chinensis]|uniref:K Homology domain-containing protein n=1 Tax=Ranatra chinensis TaxID=642074 RepID=A0ABD0YAI2_9HEMI